MGQKQLCTGGVVTAAGLSSRMGDFKPLLPYGGSTIIQTTVGSLQSAGVQRIIAVVGHRGDEIESLISGMEHVKVIYNTNYRNGDMLESVRLGLEQLAGCDAAYVLPGDMPAVSPGTFRSLQECMAATGAAVVFPVFEGRKRHPPLIAGRCFDPICGFRGEGGLRMALQQFQEQTRYAAVEDLGCALDADTPEDYHRLLRYHS